MKNSEITDIEKYCSPASLLVINNNGELIRLFCPFRVLVIHRIGDFKEGETVPVSQVKVDARLILVYVIKNKGYYYWNFTILI